MFPWRMHDDAITVGLGGEGEQIAHETEATRRLAAPELAVCAVNGEGSVTDHTAPVERDLVEPLPKKRLDRVAPQLAHDDLAISHL